MVIRVKGNSVFIPNSVKGYLSQSHAGVGRRGLDRRLRCAVVAPHGPTTLPKQAASCAAHAFRTYASKGSLDTVFEALPGLSLRVLLLSRFAARIPTLCCTNPWCLAAM